MRRMVSLIGLLMLATMLWTGTAAHAAEAMDCVEVSAEAVGHFDGDEDQTPADADKAVSHHHGGCHGHHVGVSSDAGATVAAAPNLPVIGVPTNSHVSGADPGTALRPPIA